MRTFDKRSLAQNEGRREDTAKRKITIEDLIKKRKQRWEERHDMNFDAELASAIADKIIDTPSLTKAILEKPYLLIECCFSLVDKKKRNVPFFLNEVQRDFIEKLEQNGRSKPYFILKGRQQGFTTVITAIQLAYAIVTKNFAGFTLADRDDNTKAIKTGINKVIIWCIISTVVIIGIIIVLIFVLKKKSTNKKL